MDKEQELRERGIRWIPLSRNVLVVAKPRVEGTWKAYIDAVPGMDHPEEVEEVLRQGVKVPERIARAAFPSFDDTPYAR